MSITSRLFGYTRDQRPVTEFTLTDADGSNVKIINYGCAITEMNVPKKDGTLVDVTLGYDTVEAYEKSGTYFGTICGRCSNRIANGVFSLNGKEYHLYVNDGPNSLHGGKEGFCFKLWDAEIQGDSVVMKYVSPDMEENYPGELTTVIVFSYKEHKLRFEVSCTAKDDTIANVINHSYFNLNGHDSGTVLEHSLYINADEFCESDEHVMPYRAPIAVANTPFDFTQPHKIGERLFADCEQIKLGRGYDHNWCLNNGEGGWIHACRSVGDQTGITLDVYTDLPGVQFYSGNVIGDVPGKNGCCYGKYTGYCLETQQYPNAIHVPEYPSVIIRAGETKTCATEYVFGVEE